MLKRACCFLLILSFAAVVFPAARAEDDVPDTFTYSSRGQGICRLGNTGYLVDDWREFVIDSEMRRIRENGAILNERVPLGEGVKKYVYFIESSRSANLDGDLTGENEICALIRSAYETDGFDTLALESPYDYMNWFYKSDHHWNYKGSYQGYCDIVRMIFGEDEPLIQPVETVTFPDIPFNGSYNSTLGYSKCDELFTVYRFDDLPEYTVTINGGREKRYGRPDTYFNGKYPRLTVYNHYARFYGGDPGEMIIHTDQPDKPNLLLIANSYSNAVTLPLAKHCNTICSVDPRFYRLNMKTDFRIRQYIKKHDIDIILVMGDIKLFSTVFPMQ